MDIETIDAELAKVQARIKERNQNLRERAGRLFKVLHGREPSIGEAEVMNMHLLRTFLISKRYDNERADTFYHDFRYSPGSPEAERVYHDWMEIC